MASKLAELAKRKQYNNLIAKSNAGKILSTSESKQLEELAEAFDDSPKPDQKAHLITSAQLAKMLRVTVMSISNWTKAGMPKAAHGYYDLFLAFDWWMDNINSDPADVTTADARGRYWNAKAEEAEIKVSEIKGNLLPRQDVESKWGERIAEFRQGCLSMPVRLPPLLDGKSAQEMRQIIKVFAYALLDGYARVGKYCGQKEKKKRVK